MSTSKESGGKRRSRAGFTQRKAVPDVESARPTPAVHPMCFVHNIVVPVGESCSKCPPDPNAEFQWKCPVHLVMFSTECCIQCQEQFDAAMAGGESPSVAPTVHEVTADELRPDRRKKKADIQPISVLKDAIAFTVVPDDDPPPPVHERVYQCDSCKFSTNYFPEMTEHMNGTYHGDFTEREVSAEGQTFPFLSGEIRKQLATGAIEVRPVPDINSAFMDNGAPAEVMQAAVQTELFTEPRPMRKLRTRIPTDRILELNAELAMYFCRAAEEQAAADLARERARGFEAEMKRVGMTLRDPFEIKEVQCEWRVSLEDGAKQLVRLDTLEVIAKRELSAEDRARADDFPSGNEMKGAD